MGEKRKRRYWSDDEKREIVEQTYVPGVSVAQVARRYAANANMVFKWRRDPQYSPRAAAEVEPEGGVFLPVEISSSLSGDVPCDATEPLEPVARDVSAAVAPIETPRAGHVEITLSNGHRLSVSGGFDAEALALLIRRLSS